MCPLLTDEGHCTPITFKGQGVLILDYLIDQTINCYLLMYTVSDQLQTKMSESVNLTTCILR